MVRFHNAVMIRKVYFVTLKSLGKCLPEAINKLVECLSIEVQLGNNNDFRPMKKKVQREQLNLDRPARDV